MASAALWWSLSREPRLLGEAVVEGGGMDRLARRTSPGEVLASARRPFLVGDEAAGGRGCERGLDRVVGNERRKARASSGGRPSSRITGEAFAGGFAEAGDGIDTAPPSGPGLAPARGAPWSSAGQSMWVADGTAAAEGPKPDAPGDPGVPELWMGLRGGRCGHGLSESSAGEVLVGGAPRPAPPMWGLGAGQGSMTRHHSRCAMSAPYLCTQPDDMKRPRAEKRFAHSGRRSHPSPCERPFLALPCCSMT